MATAPATSAVHPQVTSAEQLGQCFLRHMESLNWENLRVWDQDIVEWHMERVKSQLDSDEQRDEQARLAREAVQWMVDKYYVDRTTRGLELVALAPFRQASLFTQASFAQPAEGHCTFGGEAGPHHLGVDWTWTSKKASGSGRRRTRPGAREDGCPATG